MKRSALLLLALVLVSVIVFALRGQIGFTQAIVVVEPPATLVRPAVLYGHLFRHISAFEQRAEENELRGEAARPFRDYFRRHYALTDDQDQALKRVALKCIREIKAIDERARVALIPYREQFPNGQAPQGRTLEPPPIQELRAMNAERDALLLSHRDELREVFGADAFEQFHRLVEIKVGANSFTRPATTTAPEHGGQE